MEIHQRRRASGPCAALLAGSVLAAVAPLARAESPQDHFWAQLEYFVPAIESSARLDATDPRLRGTKLSLEGDLGLRAHKGTPYALLGARLGDRWRLEFEYYALRRSGSRTIGRDVQWDDRTFPISTRLDASFESTIYRLTAGWSFLRSPQGEAGVAIGLHTTDFKLSLAGQAAIGATAALTADRRDQFVPLPTVGVYGTYALTPEWMLRGRVDFLPLRSDRYEGSLTNLMAAVDWRFAKNLSVGVGYRLVNYQVELSRSRFNGELNYRFHGPTVYLSAAF